MAISAHSPRVRFCAAGDVLFDRGVRKTLAAKGPDFLFAGMTKVLRAHDLAFCNLECPLTSPEAGAPLVKKYSFRGDPQCAQVLKRAGFNVISVANNHTVDWGREGFLETTQALQEAGLRFVGGGADQAQAHRPVIIRCNGLTFAFFASVSFLLEGFAYATDRPGPAVTDMDRLEDDIRRIRNQVDFVVVSFHWGSENQTIPNSAQIEYAHRAVEAGADLVLGHHPHVIQTVERYRSGWVVYSLGNFLFDNSQFRQRQAVVFSCVFEKGRVSAPVLLPVSITDNCPRLAVKRDRQEILNLLRHVSAEGGLEFAGKSRKIQLVTGGRSGGFQVPLRRWEAAGREIRAFSSRLELDGAGKSGGAVFSLPGPHLQVLDACMVADGSRARVYAVLGGPGAPRGSRLVVFPIDCAHGSFLTPLMDSHRDLSPWKIRAADVDGDGDPDILVGVWKKTPYDPRPANRLFVYNRSGDSLYPKWLGSRLGPPFDDFEPTDLNGDGRMEVITLANRPNRHPAIFCFGWAGFGFQEMPRPRGFPENLNLLEIAGRAWISGDDHREINPDERMKEK